jgi:hypothetical protein
MKFTTLGDAKLMQLIGRSGFSPQRNSFQQIGSRHSATAAAVS